MIPKSGRQEGAAITQRTNQTDSGVASKAAIPIVDTNKAILTSSITPNTQPILSESPKGLGKQRASDSSKSKKVTILENTPIALDTTIN